MDKKYANIRFETPPGAVVQEGNPVGAVPKEIVAYYLEHDYGKKGIPLSVKTIQDIAETLGINAQR